MVSIDSKKVYVSSEVTEEVRIPSVRRTPFNFVWKLLENLCDEVVIGADFLAHYHLLVDKANRKLIKELSENLEDRGVTPEELLIQKLPDFEWNANSEGIENTELARKDQQEVNEQEKVKLEHLPNSELQNFENSMNLQPKSEGKDPQEEN